jgi:peptidyl-prolyl cis-trans isomerase C
MRRALKVSLVALLVAAAAAAMAQKSGGEAEQKRRAAVLAKFEGGQITVGDLEDAINQQSYFVRKRYATKENRKSFLDNRVRFELLAREAERRGYGDDETVVQTAKQNAVQALLKNEVDDKMIEDSIPDEEVKKYYDEHRSEFVREESRRVNYILLETRQEAAQLVAEAREADLRKFGELARENSIDQETRLRAGDLRYFDRKGVRSGTTEVAVEEAIVKAAFALEEIGDVAPEPVPVEDGFAVVKLSGRRPASKRTLEQVDKIIRKRLWRVFREKAVTELESSLRAKYKPEVHPELVDDIKLDVKRPGENIAPGFPTARRPATPPAR